MFTSRRASWKDPTGMSDRWATRPSESGEERHCHWLAWAKGRTGGMEDKGRFLDYCWRLLVMIPFSPPSWQACIRDRYNTASTGSKGAVSCRIIHLILLSNVYHLILEYPEQTNVEVGSIGKLEAFYLLRPLSGKVMPSHLCGDHIPLRPWETSIPYP